MLIGDKVYVTLIAFKILLALWHFAIFGIEILLAKYQKQLKPWYLSVIFTPN